MSKLNPARTTGLPLMEDGRLAGGYGVKAEKETDIQLLRRAALANRLWEDPPVWTGRVFPRKWLALLPDALHAVRGVKSISCRMSHRMKGLRTFSHSDQWQSPRI